MSDIVVIGAGAYGTALAVHWSKNNKAVTLVTKTKEQADLLLTEQENKKYLKGISLHGVSITNELSIIKQAKIVVLAIPSQEYVGFLPLIQSYVEKGCLVVIASKGIDVASTRFLSDIVKEHLSNSIAVWSGPQFAFEVASLLPSAVTLACQNHNALSALIDNLSTPILRIYPTTDVLSVELSGALKNVIAIACGIARGKNLGENAIAALMTRGLSEICRLGLKMGGCLETFLGLSGMGDLVLTCSSLTSRNTQFGMQLAQSSDINSLILNPHLLAEGIFSVKAAYHLSKKYNVYMPITTAIYHLLYEQIPLERVILDLLSTKTHPESE
ncbi:MAG: NAD(P)-dependent glycerol-3-phosphate dehydrogenase [Proteobacteria bacterium]|nr:NAD(P)-dependent glycerol-3-phosphate dehydrogenase [Pseudomonadota bacterium]